MTKPLVQSTGRRKAAVARVRLRPGSGVVTVNRRPIDEYFPSATHRMIITEPMRNSLRGRLLVGEQQMSPHRASLRPRARRLSA